MLSSHVGGEACERKEKKDREKEAMGDKGGFQGGRAHFETEVRDLAEVCFPRGTTTFHRNISKMLFRPSSKPPPPPPSFAISALICLSADKMKFLYPLRLVTVHLLQASTGQASTDKSIKGWTVVKSEKLSIPNPPKNLSSHDLTYFLHQDAATYKPEFEGGEGKSAATHVTAFWK